MCRSITGSGSCLFPVIRVRDPQQLKRGPITGFIIFRRKAEKMITLMIQKLKKNSAVLGLAFTLAAALFTLGMTYMVYFDLQAYVRMQSFLFDCGVDTICAVISAGLYYGCMK